MVQVLFIAAARLSEPLSFALQNLAATFNAKLQIERMRAIERQPVQTGGSICAPDQYDIVFDHVPFACQKGEGVIAGCVAYCKARAGCSASGALCRR